MHRNGFRSVTFIQHFPYSAANET